MAVLALAKKVVLLFLHLLRRSIDSASTIVCISSVTINIGRVSRTSKCYVDVTGSHNLLQALAPKASRVSALHDFIAEN